MRYCPECGGNMSYVSLNRRYICNSCGLSLNHQEMMEMRDLMKSRLVPEVDRKQDRKEYLQWWLSKKK